MYDEILSVASNLGYDGLSYTRCIRDENYFATNQLAMSDDYKKRSKELQNKKEENYLGFTRNKKDEHSVHHSESNYKLLEFFLCETGKNKLFEDESTEKSTILSDLQVLYYIINNVYTRIVDGIASIYPEYVTINKAPLSACYINIDLIKELDENQKENLLKIIEPVLSTEKPLSEYFKQITQALHSTCDYKEIDIKQNSIEKIIEVTTNLKKEIEGLIEKELINSKNKILKLKNVLNGLNFIKASSNTLYNEYKDNDSKIREELKQELLQTYIYLYKNRNVFRYNEIIRYCEDILQDPQLLGSKDDDSISVSQETYMKIIDEINNTQIDEIKDFDIEDFKFFITRISAEPLCEYQMLYSYDHNLEKCRHDVYNDIIDKTFNEQSKQIKILTIDKMFETKSYTLYDTIFVNEEFLPIYLEEKGLNIDTLEEMITKFENKGMLEDLIKSIPLDYIEDVEKIIMDKLNKQEINPSGSRMDYLYKEFVKRDDKLIKVKEK